MNFQALGTHWWIELPDDPKNGAIEAKILRMVNDFESSYSRFKPDSYTGRLNSEKRLTMPPKELLDMLKFAQVMHEASGGIFNITVGAALESHGYGHSAQKDAKISKKPSKSIHISTDEITIDNDVRIDLGGFGKGWLIDKIGAYLENQGIVNFVINGGGDIYVHSQTPITFVLEHPYEKSQGIAEISLTRGGLAASSAIKRVWKDQQGAPQHHIINPASGSSESRLASVHILAQSALIADTLGTIFLLAKPGVRNKLAEMFSAPYLAVNRDLGFFKSPAFPAEMYV